MAWEDRTPFETIAFSLTLSLLSYSFYSQIQANLATHSIAPQANCPQMHYHVRDRSFPLLATSPRFSKNPTH
jgi:hypothetical protein